MTASGRIAPVRKSVVVQAPAERAFKVFTDGIDRWWPKSHGTGNSPVRVTLIEPFVGGRWYTQCEDGSEVELRFIPNPDGSTRVELEHRDFERMGPFDGEKMRKDVDGGWPSLLELYRCEAGHER